MAQGGLGREGEWRERNRDSGHMRKNHCQNIQQTIYKSLHQWAYLPSQILDSNEGLDVLPAASHSHQCPPPVKPTLSFRFRASTSPSLGVILGQHCFGMMPRPMGCLSLLTLDEHSSSTDTFVADSPCLVKKTSSNVPLLITENETANIYLDTASDPGKKFVSHAWIPAVLLDSVSADFVH
ncbi:hypothetical protein EV363DRAFT_1302532 [Boletus edulis]|nr:hypothetical protein EV363DRAFT_1302532 [Boletus edulis]